MEYDYIECGDCLELMKGIPNNSIDLTITSPPYDNLRSYNGNISQWNFEKFQEIAKQLYRVTKDGGVVVWVVNDATVNGSETGASFKQALYFKEIGFNSHDTMIWRKPNPIPQVKRGRYTNCFEYMFVFTKGKIKTCNYLTTPCKNAGLNMSKSSYKNYSANGTKRKLKRLSVNSEKILTNIWDFNVGAGSGDDRFSKQHTAVFPEQLAKDHILSWSNPGDVVLDPFLGSGTTAKMAVLNNRHYIGFELDPQYYDIACKRLDEAEGVERPILGQRQYTEGHSSMCRTF